MAMNLGFGAPYDFSLTQSPLGFGQADMPARDRRSWQARIFDRLSPTSDLDLSDDDKKAIVRQGFLQLASGLLQNNNFPQALGQGLQGGLLAVNQGPQELQERRYRQEMMRRGLLGPAGAQEFAASAQAAGLKPGTPEYQRAARIGLGLDPRAVTAATKFGDLTDAFGRQRPTRSNPTTGVQEVFYAENNQWIPLGGAMPQGGAVNVQIDDGAVPPQVVQAAEVAQGNRAWTANTPDIVGGGMAPPPFLGVGQTPAAKAGSEEAARQAAQIGALPARNALEVQAAGQKAAAEAVARATTERQQEAITALPGAINAAQQTIGLLDKALTHPGRATATGLSATVDPRNYLPGTDASNFQVLLDQIKGQAFLQAFQSLRGSGAITEKEGKAATDAIARLNNSKQGDEAFVESLRELRAIAQKAEDTARRKAQGAAAAPEAPRRLKFNPATGKLE